MFQRCQHRDLSSQRGLEGSTISTRFSISSSFLLLDLSLRSYPHLQKSLLQNMDQDPLHIAGGVQVPSMYRSSTDYRSTCSHFGCKIGVAVNSPYCCPAHMSQFPDDNTFALRYIGGFVDGTDLRRSCMVGIYNKCRGYQIGVPTLPRGTIFSSLPWNQPNIFRTDIVGDMAYLFFTDPPHVYPTILNTGLKWDLKNREEISFPGDQVVFATPLNLKNGGDITDPVVLHTYKLWSMYLFERGGYHLYCLVRSSVANQKKRKKLEPALLSIASNKKPSKVTSAAKPSKTSKKTSAAATSSAATSVQVVSSLDHFSSQCSQFSKVKEAGSFLASRLTCLGSEPISAYESSLFCETFHMDQSGWRECYLCSKRLHCGCIASKLMVEFMDYCGIGCTHCVNCNQLNLNKRGENPNLFSRLPMKTLGDRPHMNGKSEGGGRSSEADLFSQSLRCDTQPLVPGGDKREDFMPHRGFGHLLKSEMHESSPSQPSLNIALAVLPYSPSYANPVDGNKDMTGASQSHFVQCSASSILQKPSKPVLGTPAGSSKSAQARIGRPPVGGRGKGHLLPRYCPKYTDEEVQQISGNLNLSIVPLFEKTLSASDAGRIGLLVLPKACAEAYFPPISQSEGIPLKIQDVRGKEWTFQFRFWPNNNSRMYGLEGFTPCIQSMMLQAGDTVTFSRVDPGGKLIMGSRKAARHAGMWSHQW